MKDIRLRSMSMTNSPPAQSYMVVVKTFLSVLLFAASTSAQTLAITHVTRQVVRIAIYPTF
jgi:hypothetical protein